MLPRLRVRVPEGGLRNPKADTERHRADHRPQRVAVERVRSNGIGANPIVRAENRASCRVTLTHVILRTAVDPQTAATGKTEH
eukprot:6386163-Pyramimonas_sp.AAC.1